MIIPDIQQFNFIKDFVKTRFGENANYIFASDQGDNYDFVLIACNSSVNLNCQNTYKGTQDFLISSSGSFDLMHVNITDARKPMIIDYLNTSSYILKNGNLQMVVSNNKDPYAGILYNIDDCIQACTPDINLDNQFTNLNSSIGQSFEPINKLNANISDFQNHFNAVSLIILVVLLGSVVVKLIKRG